MAFLSNIYLPFKEKQQQLQALLVYLYVSYSLTFVIIFIFISLCFFEIILVCSICVNHYLVSVIQMCFTTNS